MVKPPSRAHRGLRPFVREPTGKLRHKCKVCDAEPGMPCVVWKVEKGVRDYIIRRMLKPHPQRGRS